MPTFYETIHVKRLELKHRRSFHLIKINGLYYGKCNIVCIIVVQLTFRGHTKKLSIQKIQANQ